MVRFLFTLFICSGLFAGSLHAATTPSPIVPHSPAPVSKQLHSLLRLNVGDIEKMTGRKMSFKDKFRFHVAKLANKLLPGYGEGEPTDKQVKQGKLSMIFGLSGVFLFLFGFILPGVVFLSLPLGIAALVFGIKSVKGNGNTQGLVGIISGGALVFIWLLMAVLIALIISSGGLWG